MSSVLFLYHLIKIKYFYYPEENYKLMMIINQMWDLNVFHKQWVNTL